ncbi:hypothetical protein DICPUDRAFT_27471 [Dictyostelium purpureum]|uniref:Cell division control protein 45 n=1 Tax=Dictyostelium purpureum TaxID=5786 RepID=F0ZA76_DICPU|nr:uncharacterized protein DICPUDRAFT_27471 [Dictyostelium purpureum]EGC39154.1 hypothetical protein DICPUDRAFT_27471 [Dictyostelium purpureum]|eukprot:XP_003284300.1 hypothetical protein DICPUDRAFT_27471 [Dictyostelium purpureum]
MVLTSDNKFSEIYDIIKNDSLHGESVLILVARDCDSISACKILTEILKSDSISYNIKPVSGLEDLENVDISLLENEEIKSIIMINCGGNLDITTVFSNLTAEQVVYIFDSHRPYSIENINNTHNALIIDDGTYNEQLKNQQEEDEDDDEYDDEEEEEEDGDDDDDDEYDENDKENNNDNNSEIDENNLKSKNKKRNKRKYRNNKKNKKKEKVEKTYYGRSAAMSMYKISTTLQKQNLDDLLWYSVLGLTDQLIHEKISLESYEEQYKEFKQLILNEFPNDDGETEFDTPQNKQIVGDRIIPTDDFRFMLYRHWNLYESLYNSRFVACKLRIWKSKGKFLLDSLFAMMGIPLDQVKQKYVSMNIHYKKSLKQLLALNGPKFGLINLYFNSFLKKYQCNAEISASDTVYAVTALMESDNLEIDQTDEEIWEQNFWEAYDSISSKNIDLLKIGLKQSIELQKEITRQVAAMIEKRSVILSGPFRYAFITESSELKYFIHPLALTKLGLFMMDAFIAMGKARKPFLIGSLNEKKQAYLIVGISGSHSSDIQSNQFGAHFRKSAEYTNAILKYQSFDTSIIEVSKSDLHKFVEHLHSSLI